MESVEINATRRSVIGKQVKALRRQGKLPGVIYGFEVNPTPIEMDLREATNTLTGLAGTALVTIILDGERHNTLVREKQRDYIRGTLKHVDFQVVSMTKKIRTNVRIEHTGTAPAVKDYNGMLMTSLTEVEVEALPRDLPESFVIDVSEMNEIGSAVYVRDLQAPRGVEILTPADEVVLVVTGTSEVVEEEETTGPAEPEVIERGKREEDEE